MCFLPFNYLIIIAVFGAVAGAVGGMYARWRRLRGNLRRSFSPRLKLKDVHLSDQLPLFDVRDIAVAESELRAIGFTPQRDVETSALLLDTMTYARLYDLADPPSWAAVYILAQVRRRTLRPAKTWIVYYTFLREGALVTGNLPYLQMGDPDLPRGVRIDRVVMHGAHALWDRHRATVEAAVIAGAETKPIAKEDVFDRITLTEPIYHEDYDFIPRDGTLWNEFRRQWRRLIGK